MRPIIVLATPILLIIATTVALWWSIESSASRHQLALVRRQLFSFSTVCPPQGFDALPEFDIDSYISALWYPIQAAPVIYAQGQSYCSVVKYERDEGCFWCLFDNRPRIRVRNRGLSGSIDGSLNDARIQAFVPNPDSEPAKIQVGPPQFLSFKTNYWVIAADTYEAALANNVTTSGSVYEWALIAGGNADRETENGKCLPGKFGSFDTRGLWMFARDPNPPAGVIEAVTNLAEAMGLDTASAWKNPVIHEGCTYDFLNED